MIFPLLLGIGIAAIAYKAGQRKSSPLVVGHYNSPKNHQSSIRFLPLLIQTLEQGYQPTFSLLSAAYDESVAIGDSQASAMIMRLVTPKTCIPHIHIDIPTDEPQVYESVETDTNTKEEFISSPPIDGIEIGAWQEFVSQLRTRKPAWQTDRHIGAFEHNRQRLQELKIDPTTLIDFNSQYDAFCKDINSYSTSELLPKYCGQSVEIDGQSYSVTKSGLLGLLKAAGPKAESWLTNPSDRSKFPNTTEVFKRCNDCF